MSSVRSLRIKIGHADVGSLFALDDGRVYFRFDEAYAMNPLRPILSTAFMAGSEPETQAQLLDPTLDSVIGSGNGRLPVFFKNLLPEGMLRKHLLGICGINERDELGLLAFCGEDLPGDVWAVAEKLSESSLGRLITQGRDSYEMSSHQLPTPEAVSLSGVQPKVSLVATGDGRYVMRSKDNGGHHFIGKLPASDYAGLPELEYVSMQLAKAAGVNVCETTVLPLSAIPDQLPFSLRDDARHFLLVSRFDRDVDTATGRLHMEDFAQVLEYAPEDKYDATYAAMGIAIQLKSIQPVEDLFELLRRIKVNELLGNFDAHAKNFSFLFDRDGQPSLSPAYDIVAYSAYLEGNGHALKFYPDQPKRANLTPMVLRQLANIWQIPETKLKDVVAKTVDSAMRSWEGIISNAILPANQKTKLLAHMDQNSSVTAWRKRFSPPPIF